MHHSLVSAVPSWSELESRATGVAQHLRSRQLAFSNEQPPPSLFEHLIPAYEICDALHSSVDADGDAERKAPLLHLLQTHPLVFNVYNSSIVARIMHQESCTGSDDLRQPHLHDMPQLTHWTVLRAAQNESWCSALLADGDKFASDKNFEHAHRCYDQALQMNPESVAAWLCKARALFAASTFDDAIQCIGLAQKLDPSNSEAERLMQQVKIRIQEITGALACTSNKGSHGPDSAVDKARAKLGIHNKSAEQDLAAFDAQLLVRETAARGNSSSTSSRHTEGHRDKGHRDGHGHRRDGERHRDRERERDKDKHRERDRDRAREGERDEDRTSAKEHHKHKHRHRHRHRHRSPSPASASSRSSYSK